MVAKSFPESLVSNFIYIYWPDDDAWYRAKILKVLEQGRKFKLLYDDKNDEKIDLTSEKFLLEDEKLKTLAALRRKELKAENHVRNLALFSNQGNSREF